MEMLILDESFKQVCLIDSFESLIWTERYCGCGNFELYTPANATILNTVKQDYYAWLKDSDQVMIVEDVEISTEVETGGHLIISGRSLESILDRRIIWKQTSLNGNLQNAIKKLLTENVISPSIADRKIAGFVFQESTDPNITGLTIRAQYTGDNLYDTIETICKTYNIGFQVTLNESNQFVFSLYSGEDRSYDQSANAYVIFSPKFENIINSDYLESKKTLKNVTLVAGEDEGLERKTKVVGSGRDLARRELYTDARDIQSEQYADQLNADTEALENYKEQLTQDQQLLSDETIAANDDASEYNQKLQAHNQLISSYTSRISVFNRLVNEYISKKSTYIASLSKSKQAIVSKMNDYQEKVDEYQALINTSSNKISGYDDKLKNQLSLTYNEAINYESLIKQEEKTKSSNEKTRDEWSKKKSDEAEKLSSTEKTTLEEYDTMRSKYAGIKSDDEQKLSDEQKSASADATEYNKKKSQHDQLIATYNSRISADNRMIAEYTAKVAEDKRVLDDLYNALLEQRGKEKLSENTFSKAFTSQIEATQTFVYGEDFFKGDIVQIVNEYGIESKVRVIEIVRAQDTTGYDMYPTFSVIE